MHLRFLAGGLTPLEHRQFSVGVWTEGGWEFPCCPGEPEEADNAEDGDGPDRRSRIKAESEPEWADEVEG